MCWVDAIQLADDCCLRLAVGGLTLSLLALGGLLAARLLRLAAKSLRRSCGITGCVFFLIFAAVSSVVAQKGSTNGPAALPPRMMAGAPPLADVDGNARWVSPEEVDRGWMLLRTVTNSAPPSFVMPDGASYVTNWWLRGAYEDVVRIPLPDWTFPLGTNEYPVLWAHSWGGLRGMWKDRSSEFLSNLAPMSAVPGLSRLWYCEGTNALVLTWERFALNRNTNDLISLQVELFRQGDFIVRSNEVEYVYRRLEAFDLDGDGIFNEQDAHPLCHEGDCFGQSAAEQQRIDAAVGFGRDNGYYRFTAHFTNDPARVTLLTVGDRSIVVNRSGEYHFLLEKGVEYSFSTEPLESPVVYSMDDDMLPMMAFSSWFGYFDWTVDGGESYLLLPTKQRLGYCVWWPTFMGTPEIEHLGPSDAEFVFTAELCDYRYAEDAVYYWATDDENLVIVSPYARRTTVRFRVMPSWRKGNLTVRAMIPGRTLESRLTEFTYGTNETPQVDLDFSAPDAILLGGEVGGIADSGELGIRFWADTQTNGQVRISCLSGSQRVAFWYDADHTSAANLPRTWSVSGNDSFSLFVTGTEASEALDDVSLVVEYLSPDGEIIDCTRRLTVVDVGTFTLPGAPEDGLVILRGTSVGFAVGCQPAAAASKLSSLWQVRRLKGDGTYEDWQLAGATASGAEFVYVPPAGGIYQARALVGLGDGATVERCYTWTEPENREYGFHKPGGVKCFGVASELWQNALRNAALSHLGDIDYVSTSTLSAKHGFPAYQPGTFKCNIFVAHCIVEAGLHVPKTRGLLFAYPPLANDWANGDYRISNWDVVGAGNFPEPGFVVSEPDKNGSGHMGILDFDGQSISAGLGCVNRIHEACATGIYMRKYRR